jgi:RecA-family ATPase
MIQYSLVPRQLQRRDAGRLAGAVRRRNRDERRGRPGGHHPPPLALNGANLERVHFLDEVLDMKGEPRGLEIPLDLRVIEQEVARLQARLLVIDPLMAFLTRVDANNDQSVRQALRKLSNMAKRQGSAVICQRHLNKGSSPKAMYRGGGSIAIIGHARVGLLVAKDPEAPLVTVTLRNASSQEKAGQPATAGDRAGD